jgi:hypothetical protein
MCKNNKFQAHGRVKTGMAWGKPCTILWGFVREGVLLVH